MKVPKGDQFLPGVSTEDLAALYRTEKNIKARDRLLAFIQRREGKTVHAIAKNLHRAPATIYDWLGRSKDGLDNLQDIKRKGPERRLTEEQLAELREDLMAGPRAHGFESSLWTGKLLMTHVLKKYNIQYVPRTMQKMLKTMGFRHMKPRPRHPKAASDEEKEAFKKKLAKSPHTTAAKDTRY